MKKKLINLSWLMKISILFFLVLFFAIMNFFIGRNNKRNDGDYFTGNELVQTIDCAPYFDTNPNAKYRISFDAKVTKEGEVLIYQQNGSGARYSFGEMVNMTTDYCHYEIIVRPILSDDSISESLLAFYGSYNTGVCPIVKNIQIEVEENTLSYYTGNEFVSTIDCAPYFDENQNGKYLISFDARASKSGTICVMQQNGSGAKYSFSKNIEVTTDYSHFDLEIKPVLSNVEMTESFLAFYGGYDNGVCPEIQNIQIEYIGSEFEYETGNEFVQTIDCAPYFDIKPDGKYIIAFDAKATNEGDVLIYQQNGSGSRYAFSETVKMTTEFSHYEILVDPILVDDSVSESVLSFYGVYNTGVCPVVKNIQISQVYYSENEFVRTIDCAPYFDENPNGKFSISFDAKATQSGDIVVYQQNGSDTKYYFSEVISVGTKYQHYEIITSPLLIDADVKESFLSFFGTYGSGVIPYVKDITIELIESEGY